MSPCTAKLSAFRSKQVGKYVYTTSHLPTSCLFHSHPPNQPSTKTEQFLTYPALSRVKPKSLFAQASAKKLEAGGNNGGALFGSKPAQQQQQQQQPDQSNPFGN